MWQKQHAGVEDVDLSTRLHCGHLVYRARFFGGSTVRLAALSSFSPQYIFTHCHVYDEEQNYVPFDFKKEEPFFAVQRKVLPENM